MRKFHVDNTVLLIAFVATFLLALNGLLGFVLSSQSKSAIKNLFQNRVLDIANTAAAMLDGDTLRNIEAGDKGKPGYQKINDTLKYFQDNIDLEYIYCIRAVGDKKFVFTVDPTIEDPGEFGSPIVYTEALYTASKGKAAVDEEPYHDAWGSFYSAYSPVFDSDGRVAGIVAVDFSAKWYDEQVERQMYTIAVCMAASLILGVLLVLFVTKHLRQRVADMTNDLKTALVAAESANKAKSQFLSNMSHEIRTPMNAIIGLDHIALENPNLPEITRVQLEKIGASAKHLLSLINDILDMSRIESGRMTLASQEFSFAKMLEQVNVIIESQCRDKGLNYACNVLSQLDDFYIGDDKKLRQILINILGNAVKFTNKGGNVTLTVEKTANFDDKATLKFTISDTGIGMSKDYLPKIFDAFTQENSSAENKYGSTGLGMAITKNFVDMLHGNISVESEKGVGTTFTVVVTFTKSERHAEVSEKILAVENVDLSGRHILLAEDMFINAEIMKEILAMQEIQVDHAENGRLAVEMFEKSPPNFYDAILMDIRMPEMGGLEAAAAIRKLERPDAKKIPIVALTANAFDEDIQRSLQVGMNAHLTKPIEPEAIYKLLAELLR